MSGGSHVTSIAANAVACLCNYSCQILIALIVKTQRPIRDVSWVTSLLTLVAAYLSSARFFDTTDETFQNAWGKATAMYESMDLNAEADPIKTTMGGVGASAKSDQPQPSSKMFHYLITFSQAMASNQSFFALVILLTTTASCLYVLHTSFVRQFDKSVIEKAKSKAKAKEGVDKKVEEKKKKNKGKEKDKENEKAGEKAKVGTEYPKLEFLTKATCFILAICAFLFSTNPFQQCELLGMIMSAYAFLPQLKLLNKSNDGGKNEIVTSVIVATGFHLAGLLSLLNAMVIEKVAYESTSVIHYAKDLVMFGTKPIELVLFIVVLVRIVTVGYVLVRYLLNENKLGLLSLLFLGAVFVGPSGYGWCNGDLYSIPPGKMLAYSFLAFSCMVVFGTFFTGAPGLLSFGLNAQILLRLHGVEGFV